MKTQLTALAVAGLVLAPPALAGEEMTLAKLDTDKSGTLTLAEVQAAKPAVTADMFAKYDTDADGVLTDAEFTAWKGEKTDPPATAPGKTGH